MTSRSCLAFSVFCNIFLMFSSKVAIFFEDYKVDSIWRPAPATATATATAATTAATTATAAAAALWAVDCGLWAIWLYL